MRHSLPKYLDAVELGIIAACSTIALLGGEVINRNAGDKADRRISSQDTKMEVLEYVG